MPQCHKSIYSCSMIRLNASLPNDGTFVCDVIEAQWILWSDLYFDQLCLIYFTKDWTKFYFKRLFTLARILIDLRDRLEFLPSVCTGKLEALLINYSNCFGCDPFSFFKWECVELLFRIVLSSSV